MRESALLPITASLSARQRSTTCPPRSTSTWRRMRGATDEPARERLLERVVELVARRLGEEAERAQVHAEERHRALADRARGREQRAVAAEHDQQIDARRELLELDARARPASARPRGRAAPRRRDRAATPRASATRSATCG